MRKAYLLRNDEIGYRAECPAYAEQKDAESACSGKCRQHSVVEVPVSELRPCRPARIYRRTERAISVCQNCLRFAGWS